MNTNVSLMRRISKDELQKILDESCSLSNAIKRCGFAYAKTFYINILRERIQNEELSLEQMNKNLKEMHKKKCILDNNDVFVENSKHGRNVVRPKIIKYNLIEYKCHECGIADTYNNKKISLQLDHINGIRDDHRIENLRWLCPNCHSQQDTSFGRGKGKTNFPKICDCGKLINNTQKCEYC